MEDTYITPDMTMRFIIWSYYYHDIKPQKDVSYASYGLFAESDVDYYCPVNTNLPSQLAEIHKLGGIFL